MAKLAEREGTLDQLVVERSWFGKVEKSQW